MTNDIAFNLGAFNYPSFYDWAIMGCDNKYVDFFEWDNGYGALDESKFETLEHKYYYIKGRLSSYSVGIKDDSITVVYANSIISRDRFVKWLRELLIFKFGKDATWCGHEMWRIETTDGFHTTPCTPRLVFKADKEVIEYFKGGDYEGISKQDTQ